jgi:hypothetical protein
VFFPDVLSGDQFTEKSGRVDVQQIPPGFLKRLCLQALCGD